MQPCRCGSSFRVAVAAATLACGSDPPGLPTRTLEIVVVTSGVEPDADGYTVQVDAERSRPVGSSEVIQRPDISVGEHTIFIGGLADNCSVTGGNPRTVNIEAEGTTTITIQVVCAARRGNVLVSIRTQGPTTYPSTYAVALDGNAGVAVDTGRVLLEVPPGQHVVQLGGVPDNCTAQGNPREVSVTALEVALVEFFVVCVAQRGLLEINTIPLGYQNPADFAFRLDGGSPRLLPSGGALTMKVNSGDHTVELLRVPPNCRVLGPNPHPVHVPAGGLGGVNFGILCDPFAPGRLEISVGTSGPALDLDGYQVRLNGTPYPVRTTDRLTIQGLSPGNHLLSLSGVSTECQINGDGTRTVFVPVGGVAVERFLVTCGS